MSIIKKAKEQKADIFNHGAKVLCLGVLLGQMIGLDILIIECETTTSLINRYIWVILDFFILVFWFGVLLWSFILDRRKENVSSTEKQETKVSEGSDKKTDTKLFLRPLSLATVMWLVYSLVLVAKIIRMFSTFALSLPSGEHLISSTFLKVSLAKAALILTLLIYAVKSHINDSEKETLVTDKLGNAATLDVLDSIMLLDMLFDVNNPLSTPIYHGIRIFGCICLILPAVPLISMVFLAETENRKSFHLNLIVNTTFRLLMGNIPHLAFRLHLWHSHKVDVSTFVIKNIVVLFVGVMDIVKHARKYKKDGQVDKHSDPGEDLTLNVVCDM